MKSDRVERHRLIRSAIVSVSILSFLPLTSLMTLPASDGGDASAVTVQPAATSVPSTGRTQTTTPSTSSSTRQQPARTYTRSHAS